MKNVRFTPYKYYATLLIILLFYFKSFSQKDSTKIYSLSEKNTQGIPTVRLQYSRFLVYQNMATSANAVAQPNFSSVMSRSIDQEIRKVMKVN
jgi:hypothetical protein